ncbi:MAG: hypothetical protein WBO35_03060 [Candidatus Saccharimonadales bacterium]
MKLSANNYAIEPNDTWYFDRLDSEQREDEAIEEFTKNFINNIAQPWHFLNRISETHCYDFFDEALQSVYESEQKSKAFNYTLLLLWANPCSDQYSKQISAMIDDELTVIAKKEFKKNPDLFYW